MVAEEAGGPVRSLTQVFTDPAIRFNEGGCDPAGNFIVGTMAYAETAGAGTVYRLTPDGDVDVVFSDVTISNGLAWTVDGTTAYYNDTTTQRIDAFSWDAERGLHDRRPFVHIDPDDGGPDGLTVDAEGGVWTALWGGSAVRHYDRDGALDEVIELPVPKVTACTLGGERLDRLFITTSRDDEDVAKYPTRRCRLRRRRRHPGPPGARVRRLIHRITDQERRATCSTPSWVGPVWTSRASRWAA